MENFKFNMQIVDNTPNGNRTISASTNDPNELQRLLTLSGQLDGDGNTMKNSLNIQAGVVPLIATEQKKANVADGVPPESDVDWHGDEECCAICFNPMNLCDCEDGHEKGGENDEEICAGCNKTIEMCVCDDEDAEDGCDSDHGGEECFDEDENLEEALDDFDYGEVVIDDDGHALDPDTYWYKGSKDDQRIVKGNLGDNPLIAKESIEIEKKLKTKWAKFLAEANEELNNEDDISSGQLSPLTMSGRSNFDPNPQEENGPVTDGSRSPMSKIIRQHIEK